MQIEYSEIINSRQEVRPWLNGNDAVDGVRIRFNLRLGQVLRTYSLQKTTWWR